MTLPASGAISLSAVNTELGLSATAPISLGATNVRTLAGVASGAISLDNLHGKSNVAIGQVAYTNEGTYSWLCPVGVTSVSVVCIGGGGARYPGGGQGGGGGGLGWKNNIPVTPGNSYTVVVGKYGLTGSSGRLASESYFINTTTVCGYGATNNYGSTGGSFTGTGGGQGGNGQYGGAGCGGYTGYGGDGGLYGSWGAAPQSGSGGGAGGLGGGGSNFANGGGGVGLYGKGTDGTAYTTGGSGGSNGEAGSPSVGGAGGIYGGGVGGWSDAAQVGGRGAVRIIWGPGRAFPSTGTADQ